MPHYKHLASGPPMNLLTKRGGGGGAGLVKGRLTEGNAGALSGPASQAWLQWPFCPVEGAPAPNFPDSLPRPACPCRTWSQNPGWI